MIATSTEVKNRFGHYLELAKLEPIKVTKDGKLAATITYPGAKYQSPLDKLSGIITLPENFDERALRASRLEEHRDLINRRSRAGGR